MKGVGNEKAFDALAWRLYKAGVRPDHLTFLQVPVYILLVATVWRAEEDPLRWLLWFAILQVLVTVIDGADGILARRTGTATRRGHLLDSLFDIVGIGITIWAAAHLHPGVAQWALALLLVNFLVYLQNEIQGTKSITYTRGPVTFGLYLQTLEPETMLWGMPGLALAGILLPLGYGSILMLTRLEWRQRLWNYYQFLTAGLRREYKAVPREQRAGLPAPEPSRPPGVPEGAAPGEGDEPRRKRRK
jgi:phosphatidylglycerophosphate synthase